MVEPPVWLPRASGTMPAATAAAEPLEEPPGVCAGLCGFRVLLGKAPANSVVTVLPRMIAPAPRSMDTTGASRDGVRPAWSGEPFSVGMSAVSMMSLRPTGIPCSGPRGRPPRRHSSAARACSSACSGSRNAHASIRPSTSPMRARHASTSCSDEITPSRISRAASVADSAYRLLRSTELSPPATELYAPSGGFAAAIEELGGGTEERKAPLRVHLPYRNSGSQRLMPGQMYMKTRQMHTMIMYVLMPPEIS